MHKIVNVKAPCLKTWIKVTSKLRDTLSTFWKIIIQTRTQLHVLGLRIVLTRFYCNLSTYAK